MTSRRQNELKYGAWKNLPGGGRLYTLTVEGRQGWRALYIKEVDRNEETLHFRQEIYDDSGNLVEIHEKFPEDKGHRKLR